MDDDTDAGAKAPALTRKEFLDRAIERSGLKRKAEARAAVEATLATLGEMLGEGQDLQIPPLGRIKVTRVNPGPKVTTVTLRLARPKGAAEAAGDAGAALADADEAG